MNAIELTKSLISCPSITPENAGVLDILQEELNNNEDNCGICLDLLVNKHTVQLDCKHVFHKKSSQKPSQK